MLTPKIEVESADESDEEQPFLNPQSTARSSHVDIESDHSRASSATSEPILSVQHLLKKPLTGPPTQHQAAHISAQSSATSSSAAHVTQSLAQSMAHKPAYSEYLSHRDDDVAFFDSILPHVKSLKMERKFQFRMQVQKLLYDMLFPPPNNQPNTEGTAEKLSSTPEKSSGPDLGYLARIVPINK